MLAGKEFDHTPPRLSYRSRFFETVLEVSRQGRSIQAHDPDELSLTETENAIYVPVIILTGILFGYWFVHFTLKWLVGERASSPELDHTETSKDAEEACGIQRLH